MTADRSAAEGIAARAKAYYKQHLRALVATEHHGRFLVLNVDTGDYEIDANEVAAFDRAIANQPKGARFLIRIGYRTAHAIGAGLRLCEDDDGSEP